jgi:hypothetical protein
MLSRHAAKLERRLNAISDLFVQNHTELVATIGPRRWYLLEGMLSHGWQSWCGFCRDVMIDSCLGTTTATGMKTVPDPDWTDKDRVAYIAKCYSLGGSPKAGKKLAAMRYEMTWGDVNRLLKAASGLSPTNSKSLQSGFGLSVNGARHLQTLRNACAHLNAETMTEVKQITSNYSGTGLRHPTDLLLWIDTSVGYPVLLSLFDDLVDMAKQAVK